MNFSWTISPGFVATWTQPSNPTPSRFDDGFFTTVQVSDGLSTQGPFQFVDYENSESDGGLEIFELSGAESIGLQFYTDLEAALIFSPGRFTTQTGFVVITAAGPAVPNRRPGR